MSLAAIIEYIEANKRIALSLFCPSLRSIENSLPLHINELTLYSGRLIINGTKYKWKHLTQKEALEMLFKNRTSPIYVHCMERVPLRKVNIGSKIFPTTLTIFEQHRSDVIFGESKELFCTENLKELWINELSRPEDFLSHPIMTQLPHLVLTDYRESLRNYIDRFSDLPVPNLSIELISKSYNQMLTLDFWIRLKNPFPNPPKKFILKNVPYPDLVILELKRRVDLRNGIFEGQKCWIVRNDDETEVVITVYDTVCRLSGPGHSISVQVPSLIN